jgi:hypothetical protein
VVLADVTESLPSAYRRDRAVALNWQAAALAACGEPERAANAALEALEIARSGGSGRLLGMIDAVCAQLAAYPSVESVARLQASLAGAQTV